MTEDTNKNDRVERGQSATQADCDDLEYLRNKYLRKGAFGYASAPAQPAAPSERAENSAPHDAASSNGDDLEALRAKYLRSKRPFALSPQNKTLFICNILLLAAVIISTLCTVIWFAAPTIKLGGVTYRGKTSDALSFLLFGENSVLSAIKASAESLKNVENDPINAITSATRVLRLMVVGLVGIFVLITTVVRFFVSIYHFVKHNDAKLRANVLLSITEKFSLYVCVAFFGSLSGGSDETAYYHGYTVGVGMTVGIAIAAGCLIAVAVLTYLDKRKSATIEEKNQFMRSAVAGVSYALIEVMLAFMNTYGVLMYALTSALQAVVYVKQYSFALAVVLFPLLNFVAYGACVSIHTRAARGFVGAFSYLTTFDSAQLLGSAPPNKHNRITANFSLNFTFVIAASAAALLATALLSVPAIGLGWSFDYYPYLTVILAVASIGQILIGFTFKQAPASTQKSAPQPIAN